MPPSRLRVCGTDWARDASWPIMNLPPSNMANRLPAGAHLPPHAHPACASARAALSSTSWLEKIST